MGLQFFCELLEAFSEESYLIVHSPADPVVSGLHTRAYAEELMKHVPRVTYIEDAGYGHGGPMSMETFQAVVNFPIELIV